MCANFQADQYFAAHPEVAALWREHQAEVEEAAQSLGWLDPGRPAAATAPGSDERLEALLSEADAAIVRGLMQHRPAQRRAAFRVIDGGRGRT